jgi:predicted nucleic acid-binding protein
LTTLAIDTSALVKRYVEEPESEEITAIMDASPVWCASALVRGEVTILLSRLATGPAQAEHLTRLFHADWDSFHVVPIDEHCLTRAAEIGADFGLRMVDAIHLAAATRLPRPVRFLTLDPRQVLTAVALDLEPIPTPTD